MKNLILLSGVALFIFLFAFREKDKKPPTFAEIIKQDSSRVQELMKLANDIYKLKISERFILGKNSIDPEDEITKDELQEFRHNLKLKHKDKRPPAVRVSAIELQEIMGTNLSESDTLTFYFGAFSNNEKRIQRYNEKYGKRGKYSYDMLKDRPAFAVQLSTSESGNTEQSGAQNYVGNVFLKGPIYILGRICPPPAGGCD